MGRGRAKAKQTKVARQLKYGPVHSDLGALQAELSSGSSEVLPRVPVTPEPDEVEDDDPYAAYIEDDEDDDAPIRHTGGA